MASSHRFRYPFLPKGLSPSQRAKVVRNSIYKFQNGLCFWCKQPMVLAVGAKHNHNPNIATLDHVVPRSHGGNDELTNLVVACNKCNQEKGNKLVEADISERVLDLLHIGNF